MERGAVIGSLIRKAREDAGLTLQEVVDIVLEIDARAEISPPTLSRLERGEGRVHVDRVDLIAKALKRNPDDFLLAGDEPAVVDG